MFMKIIINARFIRVTLLIGAVSIFTLACGNKKISNTSSNENTNLQHTKVQIEMEDGGKMVFELYPEFAPETVNNFINLVKSHFYDGLKFHRIIKGFMIQGGDPKGDGTGGSNTTIKGEFSENGFLQNTLKHTKGVISMARSSNPNSASSQFFIMDADVDSLNGKYAAFGNLIDGEATLDKISDTPVDANPNTGEASVPKVDIKIKEITIVSE